MNNIITVNNDFATLKISRSFQKDHESGDVYNIKPSWDVLCIPNDEALPSEIMQFHEDLQLFILVPMVIPVLNSATFGLFRNPMKMNMKEFEKIYGLSLEQIFEIQRILQDLTRYIEF